jgi:UDP:flavonoid glycosyltransferase YjiC (YdhE family)
MARILVSSIPVIGHINPLVPIVREARKRGHEVCWCTGAKYRSRVEETGAQFVSFKAARDYDDAQIEREFPDRAQLRGIAQLKFDMKHVFIDNGPGQLKDLQQIAQSFEPDVLFGEAGSLGASSSELRGVPVAVLGVIPLHEAVSTLRRLGSASCRMRRLSDVSATAPSTGRSSMSYSGMCSITGTKHRLARS